MQITGKLCVLEQIHGDPHVCNCFKALSGNCPTSLQPFHVFNGFSVLSGLFWSFSTAAAYDKTPQRWEW